LLLILLWLLLLLLILLWLLLLLMILLWLLLLAISLAIASSCSLPIRLLAVGSAAYILAIPARGLLYCGLLCRVGRRRREERWNAA